MAFKVTNSETGALLSEGVDGGIGQKHLMDLMGEVERRRLVHGVLGQDVPLPFL